MSGVTAINGIPWPELVDSPNIEEAVKPAAEHIDSRIIPRFATTSARDTAIVAPVQGMAAYVNTHGLMLYSPDSVWVPMSGTAVAVLNRSANTAVASATSVLIAFDATAYAPYGGHSTITNPTRFTAPFPGWYSITCQAVYSTLSGDFSVNVHLLRNGSGINRASGTYLGRSVPKPVLTALVEMNGTTDYLELQVAHGDSVSNTVTSASMQVTYAGPAL